MDVYSSDKMDVYQRCNISKFSKFYTFLIPYSYINASLLPDHHHLKRKLRHAAPITGCVFSRHHWHFTPRQCWHFRPRQCAIACTKHLDTCSQINTNFLIILGRKKINWGKISSSGKKTVNFKMRVHIMPWEKNLLVITKQLQSKPYQGQSFANWTQAAPRADGTDAMTNSSITTISLGLAVYLTTTSVLGSAVYRVLPK